MAGKSTTTTLTREEIVTGLSKSKVSVEEEQVLRMRQGAKPDARAPLGRKAAEGSEAADELLLMEMQLLKAYREHLARQNAPASRAKPTVQNRTKDKIVRALRKKH